jgi:hypothetical protein
MLTTKNVHFVKLSKCVTDFTIVFLSSRWLKTYMERPIWGPDEGVMPPERCSVVGTSGSSLNFQPAPGPELPAQA